ncbi:lipid kinase [Salinarimonas soli]|uniref:Lipid kinase n=1 Tax=Salinarimonas soli TaxID=1638099 RepID=A0A5B2V6L3_9HYPH|nr:lipid kinase [Salinarimonas soli]KAA2235153.1 lipid kinase [Salinarimonas soli]
MQSSADEKRTKEHARPGRPRALVLVNAKSRLGADVADSAGDLLGSRGLDVRVEDCNQSGGLSSLIRRFADRVDLVIVGGGDGTMNAAAAGLIETRLPLGILPLGTGNDLARTLGLPLTLEAAADVIAAGHQAEIDVGEVNGLPFFNVASIGLSAELAVSLTGDLKRRWGRFGYAIAAMRVLTHAKPFRATIRSADGSARVVTLQVAVGNGRFYGGGNVIRSDARIDDANLDLYSLEMTRAWKLALMARSFRIGEHGAWREVRQVRAEEFDVITRRPKPVNADGEIITRTPARFRVLPKAVRVFVPKPEPSAP